MTVNEYRYDVDGVGNVRGASDETWVPSGKMLVDGVRKATWLGPFDTCERDLLRVAAAVLDADRLSPRRGTRGNRGRRDLGWQRTIEVRIAVEEPSRWEEASAQLARLLHFMTDDAWSLSFCSAPRPSVQQVLPRTDLDKADEIALFSGGLDSIAGLYARSCVGTSTFVAVSACGNEVRGRAQAAALQGLRDLGVNAACLKLVHQLRAKHRGRNRMESSQRSRAFLFLAMGAVTASRLDRTEFSVYETGVGCINLPMFRAQVGTQSTRAMHPRTLALFDDLLKSVLDQRVRVVAPFFTFTKGELCRGAGEAIDALARLTMSCDEGDGHKPDAMEHCGTCTSCLFRRIALFSTGHRDPTRYRDLVMRRHGQYEQFAFENHAGELSACNAFADLVAIDPNVRFASKLPVAHDVDPHLAEVQIVDLYRRYAEEIRRFFEQARPALAVRAPADRKEKDRDLFAAIG